MATSFAQMRVLVIDNTKRPELVAVTDNAIKMATLRAHQVEFFPRDRAELAVTYTVPTNNELFVTIPTIFASAPLLRTPDFLQGEDATTYVPCENLEYVANYKDFWDNDNILRNSVFTQMGENLKVKFAAATGRARLYYYKNPDTSSSTYASWIADLHPEELAMWAAGIVWARTGFLDQARVVKAEHVDPFKQLLGTSYFLNKL